MNTNPLRAFGAFLFMTTLVPISLGILGSTQSSLAAPGAGESSTTAKPTIVLVHGAFA